MALASSTCCRPRAALSRSSYAEEDISHCLACEADFHQLQVAVRCRTLELWPNRLNVLAPAWLNFIPEAHMPWKVLIYKFFNTFIDTGLRF